ncbi:hypothetical protein AAMO2058_000551200 [Amorphochlora amoebiformis]
MASSLPRCLTGFFRRGLPRGLCSGREIHPVVDVSSLMGQEKKGTEGVLKEMREALSEKGYFYASNCESLPEEYIKKIYNFHEAIHDLPLSIKKEFAQPKGSYSGLDLGEKHAEDAYEVGTTASVRAWDYSRHRFREGEGPKYPGIKELGDSGDFFETLDDLYERQNRLGEGLMVAFAEMLGLEKEFFSSSFRGGDMGTIRMLYYPGCSAEEAKIANTGISAHTVIYTHIYIYIYIYIYI